VAAPWRSKRFCHLPPKHDLGLQRLIYGITFTSPRSSSRPKTLASYACGWKKNHRLIITAKLIYVRRRWTWDWMEWHRPEKKKTLVMGELWRKYFISNYSFCLWCSSWTLPSITKKRNKVVWFARFQQHPFKCTPQLEIVPSIKIEFISNPKYVKITMPDQTELHKKT